MFGLIWTIFARLSPPLGRETPTKACSTLRPAMIVVATFLTVSDGTANPTPELDPSPPAVWLLVSI